MVARKKTSTKKRSTKRAPRMKLLEEGEYYRKNPSNDDATIVATPPEKPVLYESGAGWADDMDMVMVGTLYFAIFSKNPEMEYISLEMFDPETGEMIGEVYTDIPEEIKELTPGVFDENKKDNPKAHVKKLMPYALGEKEYKPKPKRNAKKKASKKKAKKKTTRKKRR
jgi:hypothetical protein